MRHGKGLMVFLLARHAGWTLDSRLRTQESAPGLSDRPDKTGSRPAGVNEVNKVNGVNPAWSIQSFLSILSKNNRSAGAFMMSVPYRLWGRHSNW